MPRPCSICRHSEREAKDSLTPANASDVLQAGVQPTYRSKSPPPSLCTD